MEVARPFFHSLQQKHQLAELRIEADQSPVAFSDPCTVGCKRRCLFPVFSPRKKMLLELPPFSSAPAPSSPASNGSFAFRASLQQPFAFLTSNGVGIFASQPSLSPGPSGPTGTAAFAVLASPKSARTGTIKDGGGSTFLTSPLSASAGAKELIPARHGIRGHGWPDVSPPFVLSSSRTSPVRNSDGGTLWSRRRKSQQQLHITLPPQNVGKTEALAIGDPPRSAALSESSAKPCCTFLKSPAKACKKDGQKGITAASDASHQPSPHSSPAMTCCTFVTSPTNPSSAEKASITKRVPSVAGEGPTSLLPAACTGAGVVVRVTCSCGALKEFCFDHCH